MNGVGYRKLKGAPWLQAVRGDGSFRRATMRRLPVTSGDLLGGADGRLHRAGKSGMAFIRDHSTALFTVPGPTGDMITSVTSGLCATTTFAYDVLTHAAVYTKGSGATYPVQDAQLPMYVVSRVNAPNGVGATYSSSYSYSAARLNVQGRGFLLRGPKIASNDSDLGHWRLW